MERRSGIITLTTDFGNTDAYGGVMKGVILSFFAEAKVVDLTHEIPAGDVLLAAWVLRDAVRYFPGGTVHVAVVDPGVGSSRRGLALFSGGHFFVGPDNGIFSAFLPAERTVALTRREFFLPEVSATFHGRDVFAPVAARLAGGMALSELGEPCVDPVQISLPEPVKEDERIRGEVVQVDRFGNLVTNIPASMLSVSSRLVIKLRGHEIEGLSPCYSAGEKGQLVALIGSSGRVELAVREGSAQNLTGAIRGDKVEITLRK